MFYIGVGAGIGFFVKNLKWGYRYAYSSEGGKKFYQRKEC